MEEITHSVPCPTCEELCDSWVQEGKSCINNISKKKTAPRIPTRPDVSGTPRTK